MRPDREPPRTSCGVPTTLLATMAVALATWSGWRWYLARVFAEPEAAGTLLLTFGLLAAIGYAHGRKRVSTTPPFLPLAAVLAVYALSYPLLPSIASAAIAVAATLYAAHAAFFRERPPIAFWGLVALSLPILPSLQFVLGYPMRIVAAALSVGLLQAQGFAVARTGTLLEWEGRLVQFDAPCSGVNMLWAGLMLALMGAMLLRLDAARTMAAVLVATLGTIAANGLRGASLFYMEADIIAGLPQWWHEATGLAAFAMTAAAILWAIARLQPRERAA